MAEFPDRHPDASPRTALVTGGAKRIGRAIVEGLARNGWAVAIHYHQSEAEALELVAKIDAPGGRAMAVQADLSREAEVVGLVARVTSRLGPLGCLVNNASAFEADRVETATRESWDRHLEPNLRAPLVLSQEFARALPRDQGGAIINLIDQRVFNPTPSFLSYSLTKSALWSLTQTLALGLAPQVRVNAIAPGPTLPSRRQDQADFDRQCAALPLRRGPTPEELAAAVHFILESKSMTGQAVVLDGGQQLGWAHPSPDDIPVE